MRDELDGKNMISENNASEMANLRCEDCDRFPYCSSRFVITDDFREKIFNPKHCEFFIRIVYASQNAQKQA